MRLKKDYCYMRGDDDTVYEIPQNRWDIPDYAHAVKSNYTAHFIFRLLREEATEEEIINAAAEEFDAPRETIAKDVPVYLEALRKMGLLQPTPPRKRFWNLFRSG